MYNNLNNRGQAVMVSFLFIIIIFVTIVGLVNLIIVPSEEVNTEGDHLDLVTSDLDRVHQSVVGTSDSESINSVSVKLGTRYNREFIMDSFIPELHSTNPTGSISMIDNGEYVLEGPADSDFTFTGDNRVNPSNPSFKTQFETSKIIYKSNYNQIDNTERHIEGNFYYKQNDEQENTILQYEPIVSGNRINLLLLSGSFKEISRSSKPIDVVPISTGSSVVRVSNLEAIRVPTKLEHNNTFLQELASREPNIDGVVDTPSDNEIKINLDDSQKYLLDVSVMGVSTNYNENDLESSNYKYNILSQDSAVYNQNQTKRVSVDVNTYDEYYNRISGINGDFLVESSIGSWQPDSTVTTNSDGVGKARWYYNKPPSSGTANFNWTSP